MKKLLTTSLFSLIAISQLMSQCDSPSKYENVKYDKYHGWDTCKKPNDTELHILQSYNSEMIELRCKLRKNNHSRAHFKSLPLEVQNLKYTKQFLHKDGTVPVFKLIVEPVIENENSEVISEEVESKITKMFSVENVKSYEELPEIYKSYLEIPDENLMYSFRGAQWVSSNEPMILTTGSTDWGIFDMCESNADSEGFINKNKVPKVKIRYFIDSTGNCNYVDMKSEQTALCTKSFAEVKAKNLYKDVKFKPAIKNGKAVGSYLEVVYIPWVYTEEEYRQLQMESENYHNNNK